MKRLDVSLLGLDGLQHIRCFLLERFPGCWKPFAFILQKSHHQQHNLVVPHAHCRPVNHGSRLLCSQDPTGEGTPKSQAHQHQQAKGASAGGKAQVCGWANTNVLKQEKAAVVNWVTY
eukprot:3260514-Rhodomonas_salina.1